MLIPLEKCYEKREKAKITLLLLGAPVDLTLSAFIIIRGGKLFLMCTEKTIKRFACEC
jgi:hypothetical protein